MRLKRAIPNTLVKVSCTGSRPKRPGAVVLEFGFVAILLVFIVLGMIETSRGVMVKETLSNAAVYGCRLAATGRGSNDSIKAVVQEILREHNLNPDVVTITILVDGKETPDVSFTQRYAKVTVVVSLPVSKVYWVSALFLTSDATLTESITMMRQG